MKLYQVFSTHRIAFLNCLTKKNAQSQEWADQHKELILQLVKEKMPSGSGIDTGTTWVEDFSPDEKLQFSCDYHHMNQHGFYDGWTHHIITVTPSFRDFNLDIQGEDRNDVHEYLAEVYRDALLQDFEY